MCLAELVGGGSFQSWCHNTWQDHCGTRKLSPLLMIYLLLTINESRFKVIPWYNHNTFTYSCVMFAWVGEKGLELHWVAAALLYLISTPAGGWVSPGVLGVGVSHM
jgi:hypothetical protein